MQIGINVSSRLINAVHVVRIVYSIEKNGSPGKMDKCVCGCVSYQFVTITSISMLMQRPPDCTNSMAMKVRHMAELRVWQDRNGKLTKGERGWKVLALNGYPRVNV